MPEHLCPVCGNEGSKAGILPGAAGPLIKWSGVFCSHVWYTRHEEHVRIEE